MNNKYPVKYFLKMGPVKTAVLILSLAFSVYGQNDLIEVQSMVDTSDIYIGDQLTYSIIIKHDKNLRIKQPGEGVNLGMFEIKNYNFSKPVEKDGVITQRYDFTIAVFDTGSYTIPAFPVAYFPDSTKQYKIIEAAPVDIHVKSLLAGEKAPKLKDVKAPIDIPFDYVLLYTISGIALILIVAAILGYRAWKSKKETGFLFSSPPKARPAHEIALDALKELYNSDLLEKEQYKNFFSKLSEILRLYIEGRFFVSALEETTYEIMYDMEKHLEEKHIVMLTFVLEQSDLVKFAKYIPDKKTIDHIKEQSELFIHETKIILKEEEQEQENQPQEEVKALPAGEIIPNNLQEEKGD